MKERPKLTVTTSSSGIQRRKNGRIRINLEAYFVFNEKNQANVSEWLRRRSQDDFN